MWTSVKDSLPTENDNYLCIVKSFNHSYIGILGYCYNLRLVDKYDFPKKKSGFYNYDSEWGYSDWTDKVTHWMKLPELPEEE